MKYESENTKKNNMIMLNGSIVTTYGSVKLKQNVKSI